MKILIVCASNICRSPYVEYILRRELADKDKLGKDIEWVKSSAVFNKMKRIHPKAKVALVKEGFSENEIEAHKPSYLWFDYKRFREADIIIGMSKWQKYLLPFWLWKKYITLSAAAGFGVKSIKDPYLEKTQEAYDEVMKELKQYTMKYLESLN